MKAQLLDRYGPDSRFHLADIPIPEIVPGHVLIRVAASSVNPVDYKIRLKGPAFAPELPAILHGDVAGYISAIGPDVSGFSLGDEVYACAGGVRGTGGALAELMLADAALVAHKPASLTMAAAAALPLVSITAWESAIERANIQPGQTVLVHGGAGGVGHIGVQLAKWAGATVFATVSSAEKAAIARELGADVTINYREQSVEEYVSDCTDGKGFDTIFDTVGGEHLGESFQAAAHNGTVACISTRKSVDLSLMHAKNLSLHVIFMLLPMLRNEHRDRHGRILREIASLVEAGQLRPWLEPHVFSFADVQAAHEYLESGQAVGKVVLQQDCW